MAKTKPSYIAVPVENDGGLTIAYFFAHMMRGLELKDMEEEWVDASILAMNLSVEETPDKGLKFEDGSIVYFEYPKKWLEPEEVESLELPFDYYEIGNPERREIQDGEW